MAEFAVHLESRDAGLLIRLTGELGVAHTDELQSQLDQALQTQPHRAVLDVSGLTFICSSGLGALVSFRSQINQRGGVLRIAGPSAPVCDVFRKTRLAELFPVFPSAEQALLEAEPDSPAS